MRPGDPYFDCTLDSLPRPLHYELLLYVSLQYHTHIIKYSVSLNFGSRNLVSLKIFVEFYGFSANSNFVFNFNDNLDF